MKTGIYKITNLLNGKFYVGSTVNFTDRKSAHKHRKEKTKISRAIQKYGWENFVFEVLEYCDKDVLKVREQYYFDILKPFDEIGYNISRRSTDNYARGVPLSEETKLKMSERMKGELNPFFGKTHSDETKQKLSKINKEKFSGNRNPFYGKLHSEETKNKISEKAKGRYTAEKNPFYGKKHTEEAKNRVSEKRKLRSGSDWYKPINQIDKTTGSLIKTWSSIKEALQYFNRPLNSRISAVCRGRAKTAFGFKWEYKEKE